MEDFRRNRVGTAPSQNSAITMQVYLSFSGSFSGRWIGPGIAKERLPFWGKVWYNRTEERKNAAGRLELWLRLAGPRYGFSLIIAAQIMTVIVFVL